MLYFNRVMIVKRVLKVIGKIICIILVIVLAVGILDTAYYPHYKKSTAVVDTAKFEEERDIKIVSANVRTWSPTDTLKKSWFYRADLLLTDIGEQTPDIIGFQEVTRIHYKYLCENLLGYDNVLEYRDNSPLSEACPIFYRTDRFELIDKGSFWLSETPDKMSKDWGAACYRICSYVILKESDSESQLVVFNTHLDHISDVARINGIKVVLEKIKQFGSLPSIIMGDFNADESSETYKVATDSFFDAKYQTENTMIGATYQNWGKSLERENIDYFMISKTGISVNGYKIVDKTFDGVYPSDHYPIYLSISLN